MTKPGEPMAWLLAHVEYVNSKCLFWPYATNKRGQAIIVVDGRNEQASRIMCIEAHGPPPNPSDEARHSCGNGDLACMNQTHLLWGSRKQNVEDSREHGTLVIGAKNKGGGDTTTKEQHDAVVHLLKTTRLAQRIIGDLVGVHQTVVSEINRGVHWTCSTDAFE